MEIKQGDIFQLGEHRIAFGDAKDKELIKRLCGRDKIRTIITDPPYGVDYLEVKYHYKKDIGAPLSCDKPIEGDKIKGEDYVKFSKKWLEIIKTNLDSYNSFYIFNCDKSICELKRGIIESGGNCSQMIIWVKNQMVLGRKDYNPQHELIEYGWFGRHKFERSQGKSVIFYPKPSSIKFILQ